MLLAIGARTARQLRLPGVRTVRHVTVRHVSHGAAITFRRGFCVTHPRPDAVDDVTVKPRKPKSKVKENVQPAKRTPKSPQKQQDKAIEKKRAQKVKAAEKKRAEKEKALKKRERALEKKKAQKAKLSESAAKKERTANIRSLKVTALLKEVPPRYVATPFTTYLKEHGSGGSLKETAERIRDLTEAEREILLAQTAALNETIKTNHQNFILSKTPLQIWEANQARAKLNRLHVRTKLIRLIQDPRLPKGPRNAYIYFHRARLEGEFSGQVTGKVTLVSIVKQISEQWQALSDAERQPYLELAERDKERYVQECKALGIPTTVEEKAE